jgi:hypothetical protein
LAGTAMAAMIRVIQIAENTFGSSSAPTYSAKPAESASENTISSGSTRNSAMKPSAVAISKAGPQGKGFSRAGLLTR